MQHGQSTSKFEVVFSPLASHPEAPLYCSTTESKKKSKRGYGCGGWMGHTKGFPLQSRVHVLFVKKSLRLIV